MHVSERPVPGKPDRGHEAPRGARREEHGVGVSRLGGPKESEGPEEDTRGRLPKHELLRPPEPQEATTPWDPLPLVSRQRMFLTSMRLARGHRAGPAEPTDPGLPRNPSQGAGSLSSSPQPCQPVTRAPWPSSPPSGKALRPLGAVEPRGALQRGPAWPPAAGVLIINSTVLG